MTAFLLVIAGIVLALDQGTKIIVVETMRLGETIPVVDGALHWTYQRNPGAAFGLFQNLPVLFTILATAISIGIIWYAPRVKERLPAVAFGLVLGGALGNLVDRIVRPPGIFQGHVVDFIDLRVWPVFNVADAAVVVGAVLLIILSYVQERRERDRAA